VPGQDNPPPSSEARKHQAEQRPVKVPSAELLQGVRCAVLNVPTAHERAQVILKVVMEMVNTASSVMGVTEQEVSSGATVLDAVADHAIRMQDADISNELST
jgi:hypothetical protein